MQKFAYLTFLCFAFCFTKVNAQTVYIAETGKKYHVKNCPSVKSSGKAIDLSQAIKEGYSPCVDCGADKIKLKKEKKGEKKKEERD